MTTTRRRLFYSDVFILLVSCNIGGPASAIAIAFDGQRPESELDVLHVGMVSPAVIGLTIQAGRVKYGQQIPYVRRSGDTIEDPNRHRWVRRNGQIIGSLVGAGEQLLCTPDCVVGGALDTDRAGAPASWRIDSPDDANYISGVAPSAVDRKSKPSDLARCGGLKWDAPVRHVVYLHLPAPVSVGKRYTIRSTALELPTQTFVFRPAELRSEAVHISHIGFRPDDLVKVAFLSCWLGSGGGQPFRTNMPFRVTDTTTGGVVFEGQTELSKLAIDCTEDSYKRNYNGVDVYMMDFSSVQSAGTYRVVVDGVGCSYPFEIGPAVWRDAFAVSARGFYYQRSGVLLGPPYTEFKRPRSFHPEDGVAVYHSAVPLMDTGNGLNAEDDNFGMLVRHGSDQPVTSAWGGYMDAGDWDRRIQHLAAARLLLELADLAPQFFHTVDLNIPESGDALPDIVDEALFNLDCYRRMQTPAGGIRGGIESAEHPRHGEGSWQESLRVYAYAPGVWSSHIYAGVAARAARWLAARRPDLADVDKQSALRAMEWAEEDLTERDGKNYPHRARDDRNLAAAEMFRLTGDKRWHDLFLATTVFAHANTDLVRWKQHNQREAAWVYARTDRTGMDAMVRANCLEATLREADSRVREGERTAFRWTKQTGRPVFWGAFSCPDGLSLVRAHTATGAPIYLRTLLFACQTGAGANPVNICYTTGVGHAWPEHPLHIDSRVSHQPAPPGLTVGGPIDISLNPEDGAKRTVSRWCYPPIEKWPTIEAYWDVCWYAAMCEYTIHDPMAVNAYVWGYLAARSESNQLSGTP